VWNPCGDGQVVLDMTLQEALDLQTRLGADSPFRVVPLAYAVKAGLCASLRG
jgi:hypothetical protein